MADNPEIRAVAARLDALMAELRVAVAALAAILDPADPSGPVSERLVTPLWPTPKPKQSGPQKP